MGKIKTYNPKEVTIALGNHIVAGYADDSFITMTRMETVSPRRSVATAKSSAASAPMIPTS